jgi:hypothetical protein
VVDGDLRKGGLNANALPSAVTCIVYTRHIQLDHQKKAQVKLVLVVVFCWGLLLKCGDEDSFGAPQLNNLHVRSVIADRWPSASAY